MYSSVKQDVPKDKQTNKAKRVNFEFRLTLTTAVNGKASGTNGNLQKTSVYTCVVCVLSMCAYFYV